MKDYEEINMFSFVSSYFTDSKMAQVGGNLIFMRKINFAVLCIIRM